MRSNNSGNAIFIDHIKNLRNPSETGSKQEKTNEKNNEKSTPQSPFKHLFLINFFWKRKVSSSSEEALRKEEEKKRLDLHNLKKEVIDHIEVLEAQIKLIDINHHMTPDERQNLHKELRQELSLLDACSRYLEGQKIKKNNFIDHIKLNTKHHPLLFWKKNKRSLTFKLIEKTLNVDDKLIQQQRMNLLKTQKSGVHAEPSGYIGGTPSLRRGNK